MDYKITFQEIVEVLACRQKESIRNSTNIAGIPFEKINLKFSFLKNHTKNDFAGLLKQRDEFLMVHTTSTNTPLKGTKLVFTFMIPTMSSGLCSIRSILVTKNQSF